MTTIEIDRIDIRLRKNSSGEVRALAEGMGPEIMNSIVRELESVDPGRILPGSYSGSGHNRIRVDSINATVPVTHAGNLKSVIANSVARNVVTRISRSNER